MRERPELLQLARRLGVLEVYWDLTGAERRTSDATFEALVTALGFDASSELAAARAHEALAAAERERVVDPVQVWRQHACDAPRLRARIPRVEKDVELALELRHESGEVERLERRLPAGVSGRELDLALPSTPAPGYHALLLRLSLPDGECCAEQRLIVAPRSAVRVHERLGDERSFGLWTHLYGVRSHANHGFGDCSDLRRLLELCARAGGDFVGINPLHAIANRGSAICPYSGLSRLYRNPLYIDVEAVPQLGACADARARLAEPGSGALLERLRRAPRIDYEAVANWKLALLRDLHRAFAQGERGRDTPRGRAYARFLADEGEPLLAFATFVAIEAAQRRAGGSSDWRRWPEGLRDPTGAGVEAFRREHADEVDFQCWLQFELDAQLARAAGAGRAAGLRIGILADLALGSAPDSADAWRFQSLYARGVTIGAPPDEYAPNGQDWGIPPLDPHRLRADGYRLWTQLLRAAFRSAGALRIDHVMGLMRLFWIPAGRPGREGAYVRQPLEELLGVLALESRRAGALVVGEDLGTVPVELAPLLASWGVLSTAVLVFEREGETFRPAARWSPRALATATTHDLPPLDGYFGGRDLELRRRIGDLASDAELEQGHAARRRARAALAARLHEEGLLDEAEPDPPWPAELARAVHAFLARTPAPLVAASLDDLCGETEPLNLPGVAVERHPSWSRRLGMPLEALESSRPFVHALSGIQLRARPADRAGGDA